ncbi:hypothetical protein RHMOL_Rhmol13G0061600 [Rhododendron molle]|uniref:Uncharacterized protein n=1 Tax=Rhododendron molle TaxID=49168 RepID=A0ACC0L3K2_RHOML|nr:hypothetical protein RHMOL_Rhmol13G0061600 [Rhododendron molle]
MFQTSIVDPGRKSRFDQDFERMYLRQRNAQSLAHVHQITERCRQIKPVDQTGKLPVNHLRPKCNTGAHPSARAERNILELLSSEPDINTLAQKPLWFELVRFRPHSRVIVL